MQPIRAWSQFPYSKISSSEMRLSFKEHVYMRGEVNSNRYEISFWLKISLCVQSALYLCSHDLGWHETQNGMDFILVVLTEMKFQTGMRFSCQHNLPETKWMSADSMDVAFNVHVCLKLNAGIGIGHFDRNKISFWVIKYHVNTA